MVVGDEAQQRVHDDPHQKTGPDDAHVPHHCSVVTLEEARVSVECQCDRPDHVEQVEHRKSDHVERQLPQWKPVADPLHRALLGTVGVAL